MCKIIAYFLIAVSMFGQDVALERLKRELYTVRAAELQRQTDTQPKDDGGAAIATVHSTLRDWIELRLPQTLQFLPRDVTLLQSSLQKELAAAGLFALNSADTDLDNPAADPDEAALKWNLKWASDPGFDRVTLALKILPAIPDVLFVTAGVHITCGEDEAVYAYRFDSSGRTRIVDADSKSDWGYGSADFELSDPDSLGRRLLLINRTSVQCASSWMGLTYAVYRLNQSHQPEALISSTHNFWLDDDGPTFVLKPDQLILELLDTGFDTQRRTSILRYSFADGVRRLEPFAFQPQDFAEEWLISSWTEMQSRSTPVTRKWHAKFHSNFVLGEYTNVVACTAKPDRWSIGLDITYSGEKELKEPLAVHFLVRDLGNYRFEMEAVSDSEFEGCPGEGSPSDKHPWLSVEQLKALP
jgi:hypothetical protein